MIRTFVICLFLLVTGCADPPRPRTESEMRNAAIAATKDDIMMLRARVAELEQRIQEVDGKATEAKVEAEITGAAHESLRETFNENVRVSNENAVNQMTARGACGTEWFQDEYGRWVQRNKRCKLDDLKK